MKSLQSLCFQRKVFTNIAVDVNEQGTIPRMLPGPAEDLKSVAIYSAYFGDALQIRKKENQENNKE